VKKVILSAIVAVVSASSFAQSSELSLPGEKWLAKFDGFVCSKDGVKVSAPVGFATYNVVFEKMTSDFTLDNGLIRASFEEEGRLCRYNAIILADNAAGTSRLVESSAYAVNGKALCNDGKAALDSFFESNTYLYYGKPHNIAFMANIAGAEEVCAGSSLVGVNFVVAGKVQK
jgi:hypothetical protein